jgi:hypothetical protein
MLTKSIHARATLGIFLRALKLYDGSAPTVDLTELTGKACTVGIKHRVSRYGITYAVVNAVSA